MPMYVWYSKKHDKKIEILRNFSEFQDPPTLEEAGMSQEDYDLAEWEKHLGQGIQLVRGDNWKGSKGNW